MTMRTVQQYHKPPVPGRVLAASVVFAALALLAEYEPARRAAILAAWGFDLAILFQVVPQVTSAVSDLGGAPAAGESGSAAGEGSGGKIKGG